MNYNDRLSWVYHQSRRLPLNAGSKYVLLSDCHRGDGSGSDVFVPNEKTYYHALGQYFNKGFTYIELGDGDELWGNKHFRNITAAHSDTFELLKLFYQNGRFHMIYGNHDIVKRNPAWVENNLSKYFSLCECGYENLFRGIEVNEGIVLNDKEQGNEIFLVHGNQVDPRNSTFWPISRFLVRHLWRPMQLIGLKDPSTPSHNIHKLNAVEQRMKDFADSQNVLLVAGHTHRQVFPQPGESHYFNDGCCVNPNHITAIEIENRQMVLVRWLVATQEDGSLYIKREIMHGPYSIASYFPDET